MISKGNYNFSSSDNIISPIQTDVLTSQKKEQQAFARLEKVYAKADYKLAEKLARRLWKSYKADCKYLKLIGLIKLNLKKYEDAINYFKEAQKYDDTPEATINLAHAFFAQKKLNKAVEELDKIKKFEKAFYNGLFLKIDIYFKTNKFQDTIKIIDENISNHSSEFKLYLVRGKCELELGNIYNAIHYYLKAMPLVNNKTQSQLLKDIGSFYNMIGDKKKAISYYNESLEKDPTNTLSLRMLSILGGTKNDIKTLKTAAETYSQLSDKYQKGEILFTMAESAKNNSEFELAIDLYKLGAQNIYDYRVQEDSYNPLRVSKTAKLIIDIMSAYNHSLDNGFQDYSIKNVFVVGMPRSGTTLTESIIGAHNKVMPLGELNHLLDITESISFNPTLVSTHSGIVSLSQAIMSRYSKLISAQVENHEFIVDKMPANSFAIGFPLAASHTSRVINLDRDPLAVCWSIFSKFFPAHEMSFSFNFDLIISRYKLYMTVMNFWHAKFPGRIFDLYYEDMTTSQENTTRELLNYCNLGFDENCLNFHLNSRAINTASSQQVKKSMYQGSSEEWKKYSSFLENYQDELYDFRKEMLNQRILNHQNLGIKYLSNKKHLKKATI